MNWKMVVVLVGGLLAAAFIDGGLYAISTATHITYKVNRFTGTVWSCFGDEGGDCHIVPEKQQQ